LLLAVLALAAGGWFVFAGSVNLWQELTGFVPRRERVVVFACVAAFGVVAVIAGLRWMWLALRSERRS
jgi:hypothetical protein